MSKLRLSPIVVVLALAVLVGVGYTVFALNRENNREDTNNARGTPASEEANSQNDAKQRIVDQQDNPPSEEQLAVADITIVDATYYVAQPGAQLEAVEVRGFVANTVQSGGSCVITVKSSRNSFSRTVSVVPDAKSTWCETAVIPIEKALFESETPWTARIEYKSNTMAGAAEKKVEVL